MQADGLGAVPKHRKQDYIKPIQYSMYLLSYKGPKKEFLPPVVDNCLGSGDMQRFAAKEWRSMSLEKRMVPEEGVEPTRY